MAEAKIYVPATSTMSPNALRNALANRANRRAGSSLASVSPCMEER